MDFISNCIKNLNYTKNQNYDEPYYNMEYPYRGYAIIINQTIFEDDEYADRLNSVNVTKNLIKTLKNLEFNVSFYENLNEHDLIKTIKKVSKMDQKDFDCLCVIIMSYGNNEYCLANDRMFELQKIIDIFTSENCPSLAGKPKIFLFQTSYEPKAAKVIFKMNRSESYACKMSGLKPLRNDMLIIRANFADQSHDRNATCISEFCDELETNGKMKNLNQIILNFSKKVYLNSKISVVTESTLTENVFFKPKKNLYITCD